MLKMVLIDPGHGGDDPGCTVPRIKEKDINLSLSLLLGAFLSHKGAHVTYTREADVFVPLHERQRKTTAINPDAFISIHCNGDPSPKARGFEIFYRDDMDKSLADSIARLMKRTDMHFRGVFNDVDRLHKHLAMLANVPVPSVLVEVGFLTNPDDLSYIIQNKSQLAEIIGDGILDFLNGEQS